MQLSIETSLLTLPSRVLMRSLSFEFSSFKRLISLKRERKKNVVITTNEHLQEYIQTKWKLV